MIVFRKYKIEDWARIKDAVEPFSPVDILEATARGVSITAIENNKILACGGISYIGSDTGVAWLKMSKKCLTKPLLWGRAIREIFRIMEDSVNLKIHTYILKDFCRGEKIAKLIGLRKTDESEEYNGNTYYRYAAVI